MNCVFALVFSSFLFQLYVYTCVIVKVFLVQSLSSLLYNVLTPLLTWVMNSTLASIWLRSVNSPGLIVALLAMQTEDLPNLYPISSIQSYSRTNSVIWYQPLPVSKVVPMFDEAFQ